MNPSSSNKPATVAVIGAGLAGLTAAYRARQAGARVTMVCDKSSRAGGSLRSERRSGYLLEFGPNTVQPKEDLLALIDDLKLREKVQMANPRSPRYVLRRQRLVPLPMSPMAVFNSPLLSWTGRLRLVREFFLGGQKIVHDESVMAFARRRLGSEVAERFVAPFVSGVWAGDADTLSVRSTFPMFVEWEHTYGSVLRGAMKSMKADATVKGKPAPKGLLSFSDGMETLTRALAHTVESTLRLNSSPDEIRPVGPHQWQLRFGSNVETVNNVILGVPAWPAARYLRSFAPEAAAALDGVAHPPLAVLHLGFKKSTLNGLPPGFGFLTLPSENTRILGCVWNSNLFPERAPGDNALLTVFIGGARNPTILTKTDAELLNEALTELRPVLGFSGAPDFSLLTRYPSALPQYALGHEKRLDAIKRAEAAHPGLHLIGSYRGGVSVPDVVKTASQVGKTILSA